jgi:integrase
MRVCLCIPPCGCLRHTYAAELEDAGLAVSEISKLLGHSSAAVTARYLTTSPTTTS